MATPGDLTNAQKKKVAWAFCAIWFAAFLGFCFGLIPFVGWLFSLVIFLMVPVFLAMEAVSNLPD
jgi:hypothetical protein